MGHYAPDLGSDLESNYDETPSGEARRWAKEFEAAEAEVKKWRRQGDDIVKRFLDDRSGTGKTKNDTRWNYFTAHVQTELALLLGRIPQAEVSRAHADPADDEARVASEMLERHLNCDIEEDGDSVQQLLRNCIQDHRLVDFGLAKARYEPSFETSEATEAILDEETGEELAPAVAETEYKSSEEVCLDYVHWRDILWSAGARVWKDVRWLAFRAEMSRQALIDRFGKEIGQAVPLNAKRKSSEDAQKSTPWSRAEVWEIWDKERKQVFWYVKGYPQTLDEKDDPLGLKGFFPCPRPMLSNATTTAFLPRPDFILTEDLYNEIDTVSTRITIIERAIRVVGLYDKTAGASVGRMLEEADDNEMIAVDNWAMFAEKGGVRGRIDWLPLDQIVAALQSLRDYRAEMLVALQQLNGSSDIIRGEQLDANVTATDARRAARFASARLQAKQDECARFVSDLLRIKAEIISKHFDEQTIIDRSNVLRTPDKDLAQQAVALIKSDFSRYRIVVKPEAMAMADFAAVKSERIEVITTVADFLSKALPAAQAMPGSAPYFIEMLQWMVAGLRGASTIEGTLDRAAAGAQKMAEQPQAQGPSPEQQKAQAQMMATQAKGQIDMQKEQQKMSNDVQRAQLEVQTEAQKQELQTSWNLKEQEGRIRLKAQDRAMNPPPAPKGGPA
jgi:hypothetical protein